jgi:hypothetical protein
LLKVVYDQKRAPIAEEWALRARRIVDEIGESSRAFHPDVGSGLVASKHRRTEARGQRAL